MRGPLDSAALPGWLRLLRVLGLFAVIFLADYWTGWDISLRGLYLVPVALASWELGAWAGAFLSVFAVAANLYFDAHVLEFETHRSFFFSDALVRLGVYLSATLVLRRLRVAQQRLDGLAQTDALTGLRNRRGFEADAARELQFARREGSSCAVLAIDLDGFKAINDTLGHQTGDAVLAATGQALGKGRATDIAARLGGDEFAVLLPRTSAGALPSVAELIQARLREAMRARGWTVTFSIGAASFGEAPPSVAAMLEAADALMYEAKRSRDGAIRYLPAPRSG